MSREGAGGRKPTAARSAGTPIWVWVVYAFGIMAGAVVAFSILFTVGALVLSDDVPVTYDVSAPAIVLWGGLIVVAVVTWVVRRRQRR